MDRIKNEKEETIAFWVDSIDDFLANKAAVSSKDGRLVKVFLFADVNYNVVDVVEEGIQIVQLSQCRNPRETIPVFAVQSMMTKASREHGLPKDGVYSSIVLGYKNTLKHPFVLHVVKNN